MTAVFLFIIFIYKRMKSLNNTKIFLKRLGKEFQRDGCLERAAGLSFTSLIALVPLSALIFSLLSSFGSFKDVLKDLNSMLIKQFLPASQGVIMEYITSFIENTQALGAVGLFFFLITAVFLFNTIQNNFNAIWGSKSNVSSLRRLATYVSVLIVGSFLVSIGLNLTEMFRSLISLSKIKDISGSFSFLLEIVPSIILFFAFFLMILILPGDRVSLKSTLIGAVTGTVLWELARKLFFFWTKHVIRMSVIYGSLAAIPMLLLWLYIAWVIVLLSLEITYVHQHWSTAWLIGKPEEISPAERLLLGLDVYFFIAERYRAGEKPASRLDISKALHLSMAGINFFVNSFYREKLILFTGKNENRVVPSKSLDRVKVGDIVQCLFGKISNTREGKSEAHQIFNDIVKSIKDSTRNVTVMEYLNTGRDIIKNRVTDQFKLDTGKIGLSVSKTYQGFKSFMKKIRNKERD